MKLYLNNYHELDTFQADTIKALLLHEYVYDPEHRYVSDVNPQEVDDPSYSRVEIQNKSRIIDVGSSSIVYSADDPNFGFLENVTVSGFIVYKEVTTDLDSLVLFYWPIPEEELTGIISYEIDFDPAGILTVSGS